MIGRTYSHNGTAPQGGASDLLLPLRLFGSALVAPRLEPTRREIQPEWADKRGFAIEHEDGKNE